MDYIPLFRERPGVLEVVAGIRGVIFSIHGLWLPTLLDDSCLFIFQCCEADDLPSLIHVPTK